MEIRLESVDYITKNSGKKVLDNVCLNIKSNLITTIVGSSGSGKTTLAEVIDLLLVPSNGILKYNNEIVNSNDFKSRIGLVFQNPEEQFFASTVEKEIEFGLKYTNKDIDKIKKRVNDALKMVNLDESYLKRNPFTLSCGEKRKVAIASILAFNPGVIIFDEPVLGLDSKSKKSLLKIIRLLKNRYNKTIIIVTNDLEFAHLITDEVVVINEGQIVLQGNKYDVFTQDVEQYGLKKPRIIEFEQMVFNEKKVKLFYRDDINDLMKDVYRNVK